MILKESTLRRLFLVTVFSLPVWPGFVALKLGALPGVDPTRILILILLLGWLLLVIASGHMRLALVRVYQGHRILFMLMFMLFGWELLSAVTMGGGLSSLFSAIRDVVYYLVIFLISLSVLRNEKHLNGVMHAVVLSSIFVTIVAHIELIQGHNLFVHYATAGDIADEILAEQTRGGESRVSGTFANPLALASFICISFPMMIYVFSRSPDLIWRGLALLALCLSSSAMYHTHSRGGLVVLALIFLLFFMEQVRSLVRRVQNEWKPAVILLAFGSIVLLGALFISMAIGLAQGRNETESASSDIRVMQMALGTPKVMAKPWLGYGPGNAAQELGLLAKTVDNYYLTLALESGLPELLSFIGLLSGMAAIGWRLYRVRWHGRYLSGMITMSIVGNILFMTVLSLEQVLPIMFIAFAMLLVLDDQMRQARALRLTHGNGGI